MYIDTQSISAMQNGEHPYKSAFFEKLRNSKCESGGREIPIGELVMHGHAHPNGYDFNQNGEGWICRATIMLDGEVVRIDGQDRLKFWVPEQLDPNVWYRSPPK